MYTMHIWNTKPKYFWFFSHPNSVRHWNCSSSCLAEVCLQLHRHDFFAIQYNVFAKSVSCKGSARNYNRDLILFQALRRPIDAELWEGINLEPILLFVTRPQCWYLCNTAVKMNTDCFKMMIRFLDFSYDVLKLIPISLWQFFICTNFLLWFKLEFLLDRLYSPWIPKFLNENCRNFIEKKIFNIIKVVTENIRSYLS